MRATVQRELRVAFSKRAQPVWFRVVKWTVFLSVSALLFGSRRFWYWLAGATVAGLTVHLVWRWKTAGWTKPWGGWNDVAAAQDLPGRPSGDPA